MYRIILNESCYQERGCRFELPKILKFYGFKNIVVISGPSLFKHGTTSMVTDILDKENINYELFIDTKPNPTVKNVEDALDVVKKNNADVIIAVGGGSVIDVAKAVGVLYKNTNVASVRELEGVVTTKNKSLPVIAIPTTHGTAAEVTINYVITDEDRKKKMVCCDPNSVPFVALVDSELMEMLPEKVAASTGMDALTHAIEGYITRNRNELANTFHLEAIKKIFKYLPAAVNEKDKSAIEQMALAQYEAGMGFSNVGLGLVHAMSHPLSAVYDMPHGLANTLLLPTVMKYNGEICYEEFREILIAIGEDAKNLDKNEVIDLFVTKLITLSNEVGIVMGLEKEGVKEIEALGLEFDPNNLPLLIYSHFCSMRMSPFQKRHFF